MLIVLSLKIDQLSSMHGNLITSGMTLYFKLRPTNGESLFQYEGRFFSDRNEPIHVFFITYVYM